MGEEKALNQRVIGLKCSNGDEYSTLHYVITPFGQSSFIVRGFHLEKHIEGPDTLKYDTKFMVIPTRAVDAIYMEDFDVDDKASTEPAPK